MKNWDCAILAIATIYILSGTSDAQANARNNFCNGTCNNNICEGVANNTVVPNNDSCTQYFTCTDGNPQPQTCPSGQWFNQSKLLCDSSEDKKCNPKDEFKCPSQGIFVLPHEEFCDKYIMCFAGVPLLTHCANGLYFDRDALQCNRAEIAECELEKCPLDYNPSEIDFLSSTADCEKYFICYNGIPLAQYCVPGLHWNPTTNQCDFAKNVNCTIVRPAKVEPPQPHVIPCENGIYFEGHPNSCDHYFVCSSGVSVMLDCAPGLEFDSKNNWCDYPENARCEISNKS